MTGFRRHLRGFVTAWLVFQVSSLSAFVPRDCCLAHQRHHQDPAGAEEQKPACHEAAASAVVQTHHDGIQPTSSPKPECAMRGTCNGPLAAIAALLSNHAVVSDAFIVSLHFQTAAVVPAGHESLVSRLVPPDSPPPRA
jgi:hypothetical protein